MLLFVFREYRTKCAITCVVFWGSIAQNVLLRVSCFGEVLHKMCYYVFRILGKYRTNELLRVSCLGEVSQKMYYYTFRVLGKYRTKCTITRFVFWGSIAQNVL